VKRLVVLAALLPTMVLADVPRASLAYRNDLIRNARLVWGLGAPVATFAGQIHQESGWNPSAQSPYARGLAQFTPATADWIGKTYSDYVGKGNPFEPQWALRALVQYDKHLWNAVTADTDCDRMAFTLSGYNGGAGWVTRDKKKAKEAGLDDGRWFDHVETINAGRAQWAFKENRDYPRKILHKHQYVYEDWGPLTPCGGDDVRASRSNQYGSTDSPDSIGSGLSSRSSLLSNQSDSTKKRGGVSDGKDGAASQYNCSTPVCEEVTGGGKSGMGYICRSTKCQDLSPAKIPGDSEGEASDRTSEGTEGGPEASIGSRQMEENSFVKFFRNRKAIGTEIH